MPRLSRRALLAALATTAGCAGVPGAGPNGTPTGSDTHSFPPPPPTSAAPRSPTPLPTDTEWPQRGNTPDRRGRLDGTATPEEPSLGWSFFSRLSTPVVADGTLYAVERNRDSLLVARDAATGRQQWAVELGGEAAAVPAVGDGRLYVQRYTAMEAYDPGGDGRLWRTDFGGGGPTPPAVVDGDVYAAQGELQTPSSVASFAPDGTERWLVELDGEVRAPPAVADGTVVVASDAGVLHGFSTDGESVWEVDVASGSESGPALAAGTAFLLDTDGLVRAVDVADGSVGWTADVGVEPDGRTTPAVTEDAVIVPGNEAVVCLERADGSKRWRFGVPRGSATTPAVDDAAVYVGETGSEARIYALDLADGTERWHRRTEDKGISDVIASGIGGPPTLVEGGAYVVAADGIRAFGRDDSG
ncbi:PQQ-binding-like beta-propeller repeat protein [Halorarum halobium]|uniref:outer membrane protein assembly factor BamB family protein n=1 Tax=Halorarum halobium TaxID=3075121 RepID=UPI0028A99D52|nr:PQQ-binding-like beta-propeller repeat protein [Halobaculum sp. XH14]